jgi:hypothetical protein
MGVIVHQKIEHYDENKRHIIKGVIEHHHVGELCGEDEAPFMKSFSLARTAGGGISYEIEIGVGEPIEPSADQIDAVIQNLDTEL